MLQPNVQHAHGPALNAENFPFFRVEYAPTVPPGYATIGSELTETNDEPAFRVFNFLHQKSFFRRTFPFSGGAYTPPGYGTGSPP